MATDPFATFRRVDQMGTPPPASADPFASFAAVEAAQPRSAAQPRGTQPNIPSEALYPAFTAPGIAQRLLNQVPSDLYQQNIDVARPVLNALPAVGAATGEALAVGSAPMTGGASLPMMMGSAAAGGQAGTFLRDLILSGLGQQVAPASPLQTASELVTNALSVGAPGAGALPPGQALQSVKRRIGTKAAEAIQPAGGLRAAEQAFDLAELGIKAPLGERVAELGLKGTGFTSRQAARSLRNAADQGAETLGAQLNNLLVNIERTDPTRKVNVQRVANGLQSFRKELVDAQEEKLLQTFDDKVAAFIERNIDATTGASTLRPTQAQALKRAKQKMARTVRGKDLSAAENFNKQFDERLGRELRKEIERIVPEADVRGLNANIQTYIELGQAMRDVLLRNDPKRMAGVLQMARNAAPTGAATAVGYALGGVEGALFAGGLTQAGRSLPVQSYIAAAMLQKPGKALQLLSARPEISQALFNAVTKSVATLPQQKRGQ